MTYFPLRAKLTRTEQAAPPGTIVFLPVLESERNNSPRSRSTWLHSRSSISRNRAPVKIKRRRAAAAYGLTMVTRFSGSLGACLDFELDPSGSGQEIPIVSASLIASPRRANSASVRKRSRACSRNFSMPAAGLAVAFGSTFIHSMLDRIGIPVQRQETTVFRFGYCRSLARIQPPRPINSMT
jgi:hypothetical protein